MLGTQSSALDDMLAGGGEAQFNNPNLRISLNSDGNDTYRNNKHDRKNDEATSTKLRKLFWKNGDEVADENQHREHFPNDDQDAADHDDDAHRAQMRELLQDPEEYTEEMSSGFDDSSDDGDDYSLKRGLGGCAIHMCLLFVIAFFGIAIFFCVCANSPSVQECWARTCCRMCASKELIKKLEREDAIARGEPVPMSDEPSDEIVGPDGKTEKQRREEKEKAEAAKKKKEEEAQNNSWWSSATSAFSWETDDEKKARITEEKNKEMSISNKEEEILKDMLKDKSDQKPGETWGEYYARKKSEAHAMATAAYDKAADQAGSFEFLNQIKTCCDYLCCPFTCCWKCGNACATVCPCCPTLARCTPICCCAFGICQAGMWLFAHEAWTGCWNCYWSCTKPCYVWSGDCCADTKSISKADDLAYKAGTEDTVSKGWNRYPGYLTCCTDKYLGWMTCNYTFAVWLAYFNYGCCWTNPRAEAPGCGNGCCLQIDPKADKTDEGVNGPNSQYTMPYYTKELKKGGKVVAGPEGLSYPEKSYTYDDEQESSKTTKTITLEPEDYEKLVESYYNARQNCCYSCLYSCSDAKEANLEDYRLAHMLDPVSAGRGGNGGNGGAQGGNGGQGGNNLRGSQPPAPAEIELSGEDVTAINAVEQQDEDSLFVGDTTVLAKDVGQLEKGSKIISVGGKAVTSREDALEKLKAAGEGAEVEVSSESDIPVTQDQFAQLIEALHAQKDAINGQVEAQKVMNGRLDKVCDALDQEKTSETE